MKKHLMSLVLAFLLLCGALPASLAEEEIVDVTQYTYEIIPVLSPFCYCVYVRTDNPDPLSFRLLDPDSAYGRTGFDTLWKQNTTRYADVRYEDPTRYRVKDGYVFEGYYAYPDGGELILQQRYKGQYFDNTLKIYRDYYGYRNTNVRISCPPLHNGLDALISRCTNSGMSFFEKLDAIYATISRIAIYPRNVLDTGDINQDTPYPFLASSPYAELSLNEYYKMFNNGRMLLSAAYPYVLDSRGFPGIIEQAARVFEPDCEISAGQNHWETVITWNGESRTYGGAGNGGRDPLYTDQVDELFTFDGSAGDWSTQTDLEQYADKLASYADLGEEAMRPYEDQIKGDTFTRTIRATGGTWIRVAQEPIGWRKDTFAYVVPTIQGTRIVSDAWVDGRYIGRHEIFEAGATPADHPTAGIVVHNVRYRDKSGNERVQDVLYKYAANRDRWEANEAEFYAGSYGGNTLPDELILTRAEYNALCSDANTLRFPETGLCYDGRNEPGSRFHCVTITYAGNNGRPAGEGTKIVWADLGSAVPLESSSVFQPPESPAGLLFAGWELGDGIHRPGDEITVTGDMTVRAVWSRISVTRAGDGLRVEVNCDEGFSGTLYCAWYSAACVNLRIDSEPLAAGLNEFVFPADVSGAAVVTVMATDSSLVPLCRPVHLPLS